MGVVYREGNTIGAARTSSLSAANGIWNIYEVERRSRQSLWPVQIVRESLSLLVDAANSSSYPGSGTTLFDLSGNGRNGTLQAGVSYNSSGFFSFNNTTTGYVSFPLVTTSRVNVTMQAFVNMPASDGGAIFYNGSSGGYGLGIGGTTFDNAGNDAIGLFQNIRWIDTNSPWGTGWMLVTLLLNASSVPSLYKNTTLIGSYSGTIPNVPSTNTLLGSDTAGGNRNFSGSISWAALYDKALSVNEISQNFNALRNRYGI